MSESFYSSVFIDEVHKKLLFTPMNPINRNPKHGHYWYTYIREKFYNKTIVTWEPPVVELPKWEPYLIFTAKNVFMAKKPKVPKIKDSNNPYKKPFISYQEKLLFKHNIIPYFHYSKSKMDIKKPNSMILKLKNNSIIVLNHPQIDKRRYNLRYLKPNFRDDHTIKFTINPNYYRKFEFLHKLNNKHNTFKNIAEKNLRRLRIKRIKRNNQISKLTINYKIWKYDRLLHNNFNIFKRNNTQKSYLHLNHLFSIINTPHLTLIPKIFPVNFDNRARFSYQFYQPLFINQQTIITLILQNKSYIYFILNTIKNYPQIINYQSIFHWYTQELVISIFNILPLPYWSHLLHWIKDKNVLKQITPNDQLHNINNWTRSKRINTHIQYHPHNKKLNKRKQLQFKTTYPYQF